MHLRILVVAAGLHGVELHGAAGDAADADAAHELVVVDRGDEHLRRTLRIALRGRNVLENRVKQRAQIDARDGGVERRRAGAGTGVDDRGVQLAFVRVQIDHQVDGLGDDLVAARVRTVHLVDHGDDRQAQRQRMLEHEAGLGHRALEGVDQQQHAVDHLEHALHLAAEVGMAGGIHDVDLHALVVDGGVLGQDGDAALLFQIVAVHDAVGDLLVLTKNAALLEHFVDQRGLAVVDVRNDGDVADVLTSHFQGERPSFLKSSMLKPSRSEDGSLRDEIPQAGCGACGPTVTPRFSRRFQRAPDPRCSPAPSGWTTRFQRGSHRGRGCPARASRCWRA